MPRPYPSEFRARAVALVWAGKPASTVAYEPPGMSGDSDVSRVARSVLTALLYALRHQPDGHHPKELVAVGADPAALGLRSAGRVIG